MFERFSDSSRRVVVLAQSAGRPWGHISTEHLLAGVVTEGSSVAASLLAAHGVDEDSARAAVFATAGPAPETAPAPAPARFTEPARAALSKALAAALAERSPRVEVDHLVLGLLEVTDEPLARFFEVCGLSAADLGAELRASRAARASDEDRRPGAAAAALAGGRGEALAARRSGAPRSVLATFGVELTALAAAGELDPVLGRDAEITRVIQVLARRSKSNPVLVGDPGVGKTAVVEGLAQRIAAGEVPEGMEDLEVWSLEMGSLVAGTKLRGDFEERVKKVIAEASRDNVVLFIDEIHTVVGAGSGEGASDAANQLKPALARGEVSVIGATTSEEYSKYFEADAAFERRFCRVEVSEPSVELCAQILSGVAPAYAAHHGVTYSADALAAAARFAKRYVTDRHLPDSAVDLIDEAGAAAAMRRMRTGSAGITAIGVEDVASVVADATGVPVRSLDDADVSALLGMEEALAARVVGQGDALGELSRAVRRRRVGLGDPRRPAGSFLFAGPSGVGKTESVRALAEFLFGSDDALITIDMSEYMEQSSVSRLIGAPPGYVGHDDGGQLTAAVRRRPYSVVLLDEIEKAHPKVFDVLLQVLEEGRLTDSTGRVVDFSNTIVVMTSNAGAAESARTPVGFSRGATSDAEGRRRATRDALGRTFRPEFLNRIDSVVVFDPLTVAEVTEIVALMLAPTVTALAERGVTLSWSQDAAALLAASGFDPQMGARPLRRACQTMVGDRVAEALLVGAWPPGSEVFVDAVDGELTFSVTAGAPLDVASEEAVSA